MPKVRTAENVRIGNTIKNAREQAKLTRSDVARHVGRSPQHIRNVENGHRSCPEPLALAIADLVGIDPHAILRDPPHSKDTP